MDGNGNRSYLVLICLSAAFDITDIDALFVISEKLVRRTSSAIQLLNQMLQTDHSECLLLISCRELLTLWDTAGFCSSTYLSHLCLINLWHGYLN